MRDYRHLTPDQQAQICHQKLLELEAEHARLALDLRLAAATGIENENVVAGRGRLDLLVRQIEVLGDWIEPPALTVNANGHREA